MFCHSEQPVNSHEILRMKEMQKLILGALFKALLPLMAILEQFTDAAGLCMSKIKKTLFNKPDEFKYKADVRILN